MWALRGTMLQCNLALGTLACTLPHPLKKSHMHSVLWRKMCRNEDFSCVYLNQKGHMIVFSCANVPEHDSASALTLGCSTK